MRKLLLIVAAIAASTSLYAQDFDANFEDATLRIDYTFAGNATQQ